MIQALAPLLDQAVELLLAALLAVGTLAARRAADWLRLSADGRAREALLAVVEIAVDAAEERLAQAVRGALPPPDRRDLAAREIAEAAGYVGHRMPDAALRFGLDDAALREIVAVRLRARAVPLG